MNRRARIEIVPARDRQGKPTGQWLLRLRASNSRVLAHSETYANKRSAQRAVQAWGDAFADINGGSRRPWPAVEVDR